MNVKKYRAANSDQAMRMIRRAHGSDVSILDCYSIPGGVELVVSLDEIAVDPIAAPEQVPTLGQHMKVLRDAQEKARDIKTLLQDTKPTPQHNSRDENHVDASDRMSKPKEEKPHLAWSQDEELLAMKQEMAAMKSLLMAKLNDQEWRQADQREPAKRGLSKFMAAIDLDPSLANVLADTISDSEDPRLQREMLKALLTKKLPIMAPPAAGAIALIGPQGAGKTTTIAKLATQYVMRHGREGVAIITADIHRVGAQEQLKAYGQLLQIPVYSVASNEEAIKTFRLLQAKSLLLLDTTGLSFRDKEGLAELESLLGQLPGLQRYLVLPADSEAYVQSEIINAYNSLSPSGVILSRLDEAMRLGASLSNLIQHRLPAVWCSNGPKVPNNLSAASAEKLVNLALKMARPFESREAKVPSHNNSQKSELNSSSISALG